MNPFFSPQAWSVRRHTVNTEVLSWGRMRWCLRLDLGLKTTIWKHSLHIRLWCSSEAGSSSTTLVLVSRNHELQKLSCPWKPVLIPCVVLSLWESVLIPLCLWLFSLSHLGQAECQLCSLVFQCPVLVKFGPHCSLRWPCSLKAHFGLGCSAALQCWMHLTSKRNRIMARLFQHCLTFEIHFTCLCAEISVTSVYTYHCAFRYEFLDQATTAVLYSLSTSWFLIFKL